MSCKDVSEQQNTSTNPYALADDVVGKVGHQEFNDFCAVLCGTDATEGYVLLERLELTRFPVETPLHQSAGTDERRRYAVNVDSIGSELTCQVLLVAYDRRLGNAVRRVKPVGRTFQCPLASHSTATD